MMRAGFVTFLLLSFGLNAHAQSAPSCGCKFDAEAEIKNVQVRFPESPQTLHAAQKGMHIDSRVFLRVTAPAAATLLCDNAGGIKKETLDGSDNAPSVPCSATPDKPLLIGRRLADLSRKMGDPAADFPRIVSPRKTKLLTAPTHMRWLPMRGATSYRVVIKPETGEEIPLGTFAAQSGAAIQEAAFPKDAVLQRGVPYRIVIKAKERSSDEDNDDSLDFNLPTETKQIEEVLHAIRQVATSQRIQLFLTASALAAYDFNHDALQRLQQDPQGAQDPEVVRLMAELYLKTGLPRLAEAQFLRLLVTPLREKDSPAGQLIAHTALGKIYEHLGNAAQAKHHFNEAGKLREPAPPAPSRKPDQQSQMEANRLVVQADNWFEREEKTSEAASLYEQALATYRQLKLPEYEAYALERLGRCYERLARFHDYVTAHEALLQYFSADEAVKKARLLAELGGTYYLKLHQPERALDCFLKAEKLYQDEKNASDRASMLGLIGTMRHVLGEQDEMKKAFLAAAALYRTEKEFFNEADMYQRLGTFSDVPRDVLLYLQQALDIWRRLTVVSDQARLKEGETLEAFASFYRGFNDRQSLFYFEEALNVWKKVGETERQVATLTDIAMMTAAAGDVDKANESYREARKIRQAQKNVAAEADLVMRVGWTQMFAGHLAQSSAYQLEAADLWTKAQRPLEALHALSEAAVAQARLGQKQTSQTTQAQVLARYAQTDFRAANAEASRRQIRGNLAYVYFFNHEYDRARALWQEELAALHAVHDRRLEASTLFNLGWTFEMQGDVEKALAHYLESIKIKEEVREKTGLDTLRTDVFASDLGVYQRAVLTLMKMGRGAEALELSERARARTFLDQMESLPTFQADAGNAPALAREERRLLTEIERVRSSLQQAQVQAIGSIDQAALAAYDEQLTDLLARHRALLNNLKATQPEYVATRTADTLKLDEIRAQLDEQTTLLSYFVTPEKVFVFLITRKDFQAVDLCKDAAACANGEELQKRLDATVGSRVFGDSKQGHPLALQTLYQWLIQPIRTHLKTSHLCVIPHGVLNYAPFAALSDGKRYLIEDFTLTQLPSASLLPLLVKKRKPANHTILALANGTAENYPPLKLVGDTATYVADLYQTKARLDQQATESRLLAEAGKAETLFLSAHGIYEARNPLFSRLLLAPDTDGKNDGALNVHEIFNLKLTATNFVVLSGCETQRGELSSGDELIAFNRAFLYAGAHGVIASLWSVDEAPTQMLMKSFFTQLTQLGAAPNRAQALKAAQLEVMKQHPNPLYWSGFVLTGLP